MDWGGYTVHDAANVLRRYFNQLPEPIIPLNFYERFRDPIRGHQAQAVGDMGDQQHPSVGEFARETAIKTFQRLITEIPPLNRQLLLYILDLLAVFASKSDINQMTAPNLSIIFQPGLLSHPDHGMSPHEYRLSQDVLIFLIDNQDNFLVGMQGTAADEKTIQEVQSGAAAHRPAGSVGSVNSRQKSHIGRSASNASAGAESLRRFGGVRRNVSTSSRRSRQSGNTPSPVTPPPESPYGTSRSGGVYRSNTVPSKKSQSPSLGATRFEREKSIRRGSPGVTGVGASGVHQQPSVSTPSAGDNSAKALDSHSQIPAQSKPEPSPRPRPTQPKEKDPERLSPHLRPIKDKRAPSHDRQLRMDLPPSVFGSQSPSSTPTRERPFTGVFGQRSPSADPSKEGKKPNKLQKRRPDGSHTLGTKTSNPSLSGASHPPSPAQAAYAFSSPPQTHSDSKHPEPPAESIDQMTETSGQPTGPAKPDEHPQGANNSADEGTTKTEQPTSFPHRSDTIRHAPTQSPPRPTQALKDMPNRDSSTTIKPNKSPTGSLHSHSLTGDELSSHENTDAEHHDPHEKAPTKEKRHSRWRLSTSARKEHKEHKDSKNGTTHAFPAAGSSFETGTDAERSTSSVGSYGKPRKSFTDESKESTGYMTAGSEHEGGSSEKKGPIGWFRGKLQERKERAKSPPPAVHRADHDSVGQSLNAAVVNEPAAYGKGRSKEALVEDK